MKVAISPCPNDTFIFHAWIHELIPEAPKIDVRYADIHVTNQLAMNGSDFDIMKISYAALPWALKDYGLLPCGGALGRGCGPLVLTAGDANADGTSGPTSLVGKRVAIPSEHSTAYLLFRLWAEQQFDGNIGEIIIMPFEKIMEAICNGHIDAGLVIHEARFTYKAYGLQMYADLGEWWETQTGLPIPLGAIVVRRDLDISSIAKWIRSSLDYAWSNPQASKEYIKRHAQEISEDVINSHIDLYVNQFSMNLGAEGYDAIRRLLSLSVKAKLLPEVDYDELMFLDK